MLKLKDLSNSTGKFLPGKIKIQTPIAIGWNICLDFLADRDILPYVLPRLRAKVCKDCKGTGRFIGKFSLKENKRIVCPECNGDGATIEEREMV